MDTIKFNIDDLVVLKSDSEVQRPTIFRLEYQYTGRNLPHEGVGVKMASLYYAHNNQPAKSIPVDQLSFWYY